MTKGYKINNVALIGYGYWGEKLARVLKGLGVLRIIIDKDDERLNKARITHTGVALYNESISEYALMSLKKLDGVVIATPPETHYELAKKFLETGLHTFVEKPLAASYKEAVELENIAIEKGLTLAVGHIYLHCPGLLAIPRPVGRAELYFKLLNVAGPASGSTRVIKWAGLPHGVSVALQFFGYKQCWIDVRYSDGIGITLDINYPDDSKVNIEVRDYTGIRMRHVELRSGLLQYNFCADDPFYYTRIPYPSLLGAPDAKPEVLLLEMESFLKGNGSGRMGSEVVKVIECVAGQSIKLI